MTRSGDAVGYWVNGAEGSHGMTVVGYNDAVWTDVNGNGAIDAGEKGALRIANSWGSGWRDGGFTWLAYDALGYGSSVTGGPSSPREPAFFNDTGLPADGAGRLRPLDDRRVHRQPPQEGPAQARPRAFEHLGDGPHDDLDAGGPPGTGRGLRLRRDDDGRRRDFRPGLHRYPRRGRRDAALPPGDARQNGRRSRRP